MSAKQLLTTAKELLTFRGRSYWATNVATKQRRAKERAKGQATTNV